MSEYISREEVYQKLHEAGGCGAKMDESECKIMKFEDKIYTKIFQITEHYGEKQQQEILIEECAELIQAVQKLKKKKKGIF